MFGKNRIRDVFYDARNIPEEVIEERIDQSDIVFFVEHPNIGRRDAMNIIQEIVNEFPEGLELLYIHYYMNGSAILAKDTTKKE